MSRNLIIICIAQFITMIGMNACVPFFPIYIRELGITDIETAKLWSGLIFGAPYYFIIITVPIWGYLGDKYGRKIMMVRAIFGLTVAMGLMGFAQNVTQLFMLRIFQGIVSGFVSASLAFVMASTPPEKSGYAIGLLQSSTSAGNIIGPLFGGFFADIYGIQPVFFLVAGFCLISGLLVIFFVKEEKIYNVKDADTSFFLNVKSVFLHKEMRAILIMTVLAQIGIFYSQPIFPYYIEELGAPPEYLSTITGLMIGIISIFSIVTAPIWGKRNDRKDYRKTVRFASAICGFALIMHSFVPHYIYLFPWRIVLGLFFAAIIPSLVSGLNKLAPQEQKGGIISLSSSATFVGSLISYHLCGFTSIYLPMTIIFVISGFFLFAVSFLAMKR